MHWLSAHLLCLFQISCGVYAEGFDSHHSIAQISIPNICEACRSGNSHLTFLETCGEYSRGGKPLNCTAYTPQYGYILRTFQVEGMVRLGRSNGSRVSKERKISTHLIDLVEKSRLIFLCRPLKVSY